MTVLGPIVGKSPHVLTTGDVQFAKRCSMGCKTISLPGHEGIKDGAFVVDSAPEVERLTLDLHEDLVDVPTSVVWTLMQSLLPLFELPCDC